VVTPEELDELLSDCPVLYHMAEHGSWPSIRDRGLLSTSALLDLYEIEGNERTAIEAQRRPEGVPLIHAKLPRAVVRDQLPMDDKGLRRCLPPHISPSDWYRLLNSKVFFWLTHGRLLKLIGAGAYREKTHDVIQVDTRSLIGVYQKKIWFCPMNSGCTKPMPHPRDESTFLRIPDYPYSTWRTKRKKGERVVELAIDYAVPDIANCVIRVVEMRGSRVLRTLYET